MSTETETTLTELPHWIGGAAEPSDGGRSGPVFDPALGIQTKRVAFAGKREVDRVVAAARAAFPGWRETSLARRQAILFRFRELLEARKQDWRRSSQRARQGALRRARRDHPRSRGRRVRDRHRPAHERRVLGAGLDRHRRLLAPAAAGRGRRSSRPSTSRRWCRSGSSRSRSRPATRSCSSRARRTRPRRSGWPAVEGGRAARWGVQRAERRQGGRGRAARPSRTCARDLLRRLDPDRPVRLRDRDPRNGKRVQALGGAKNHMLVLPDADLDLAADAAINAGFGSAGERCMAISVVVAVEPVADELIDKIVERMSTAADRRRPTGVRHGAAGHRGAPRQGGVATSTSAERRRRHQSWSTDAASQADGDPRGFWLGPTLIDRVPTSSRVYTEEIFGPVLSVVRVPSYERGLSR